MGAALGAKLLLISWLLTVGCPAFAPDFAEFGGERRRSPRNRAAQRDAIVELRLDTLLAAEMEAAAIDCWLLVTTGRSDPLIASLTVSGTQPVGRAAFLLCRRDNRLERVAVGDGLTANAALYEIVDPVDEKDLGARLGERLAAADPARIAVNRSPGLPLADGLSASNEDWLRSVLAEDVAERFVSSAALVERFFGRLLDVEAPLFVEAVRLTETILAEVLSDQVVVAAGTSVRDLQWAVRDRAQQAGASLAYEPFVAIFRRGETFASEPGVATDPLLQPGDLVYLSAGLSYLGYATLLGRWAYLLEQGESEAPDWATATLGSLAEALEDLAGRVVPGMQQAEVIEAARAAASEGDLDAAIVGRLGYLPEGPTQPFGLPLRAWAPGVPLGPRSPLALSVALTAAAPAWEGQPVTFFLLESALAADSGAEFAVTLQRTPFLID